MDSLGNGPQWWYNSIMDKWSETLIIQNHWFCQLACKTCRPDMIPAKEVETLPQLITSQELLKMVSFLKSNNLLGKDRISGIRFAGEWSEPTLDDTLPEKIDLLVKQTVGLDCLIGVITNGVNMPQGEYDEKKMKEYFTDHFGFTHFPENVELSISIGDEHFQSYIDKRQREGMVVEIAEREYKEKMANLFIFMRKHDNWKNLNVNVIAPADAADDFLEHVKQKFGIPDDYFFKYGTLRLANYSPHQTKMEGAVDLTNSDEPPNNNERVYFLAKRRGKLNLYTSSSRFCYDIGGQPYDQYKFPIPEKE